jgi:hypothetical protein
MFDGRCAHLYESPMGIRRINYPCPSLVGTKQSPMQSQRPSLRVPIKKIKQEEMTGKDAFTINSLKGNIGTTVVIARYEAIAHRAL